jgi:hypothetical protein
MKNNALFTLPLAALAALVCTSATGAASILLSSEDFAVLGGSSIANTGATAIRNGNVGLSPAPESFVTGFGAGTGMIENGAIIPTGSITTQARTDLERAKTGLTGMAFTGDLTGMPLGGTTLTPGVYRFDSAANLTGALQLDAQGQDDAFWVFQIGDAFDTAANASVTLINPGATNPGIYWNIGTSMSVGADNILLGNYLAEHAITVGSNTGGSGRLLALTAITMAMIDLDSANAWNGALTYAADGTSVIPEPSTYAMIFGLAMLGVVVVGRVRGSQKT